MLERELADVAVHDPVVRTPTQPLESTLLDADAVVVATNHTAFRDPGLLRTIADSARRTAVVADPWNTWGAGQVFAHPDELLSLVRAERTDGAVR
jgi:UDP-N-acetyl-D-mannosaminuronic acid dehydrogenase